jgi:hypothetical protein
MQQFGGAYLATEGALWRTLALLLFKPGELTRQYLAGRRRHYVLPLRLYLTISVVTLLLLRLASGNGDSVQVIAPTALPAMHDLRIELGVGRAGLREGVFFCEGLPGWVCRRLQQRIAVDAKDLAREIGLFKERYLSNLGGAMFVLLPGFALWLQLVYRNRRLRYTEHLVFALHAHAFWFVALAFTLSGSSWLAAPALVAVPLYTLAAMRRVYGGRRGPRLLRAALVCILYGVSLLFALVGVSVWSLLG